jgi:thiamine-monophosphate kinase
MSDHLGEFGRIRRFFAPLASAAGLGLRDDAAVVPMPRGQSLVVTTDALVAGVHFVGDEPPELVARKALRVNLSDLAAMGAEPLGYTLALALPERIDDAWVASFAYGLMEDQRRFGIDLLGGDSVSTPGPVSITVTALGTVAGSALTRSGAVVGDDVWVSGTIGDGAFGLEVALGRVRWPEDMAKALHERYLLPIPRIGLGRGLIGIASAAMDVSDGLVQDLGHLAAASGVAARVAAAQVPLSAGGVWAHQDDPAWALAKALGGGDDYELLFTVSPDRRSMVNELAGRLDLPVARIGQIEAGDGVIVYDDAGRTVELEQCGFRHS